MAVTVCWSILFPDSRIEWVEALEDRHARSTEIEIVGITDFTLDPPPLRTVDHPALSASA
jgi:hypothetical protein